MFISFTVSSTTLKTPRSNWAWKNISKYRCYKRTH